MIIVTGAGAGIGLACVRELRARGHRVAGLDRRPGRESDVDLEVDVSDVDAVTAAVKEATERLGKPTGILSAAGYVEEIPLKDISPGHFEKMLGVHLGGLVHLTRAAVPLMTDGGSVVAVASELALTGGDDAAHYVAAKGAILGLVRTLAVELADAGVTVNAVAPGPTDTAMLAPGTIWRDPEYVAGLPTGALVQPEEIAVTAAFLLERPAAVTGQVVSPNAGTVI
ncbi:SDR family NAD(P)-dependent oxidoreductase [Amycolatopsis jejuensis]|uniref:SDR family NAD(P)-dependent oxidoreductase n=1 Tax=Amycolatopsis jejuensis TaxID=330084 RepID=UPI0005258C32|nr:SDR family oxidoreductase [Amycolatopsis jejuensis]